MPQSIGIDRRHWRNAQRAAQRAQWGRDELEIEALLDEAGVGDEDERTAISGERCAQCRTMLLVDADWVPYSPAGVIVCAGCIEEGRRDAGRTRRDSARLEWLMNDPTNGYELLLQHPEPPPETVPLLRRVWDAHRTEDWLLNAAWPEGCSAPGEHLTAAGTDGGGRWVVHDGERLRAADCEWLRHITEVQTVRRTWWRTHWQSWPPRAGQTREPRELRVALDCDPESPVQMFQLYVALGDDEKPIGAPELRTFQPNADTEMPTEAAVVIETNPAAADLLEWLAWLLFDGRRCAPR